MNSVLYTDDAMERFDPDSQKSLHSINLITRDHGWFSGVYVDKLIQSIHKHGTMFTNGEFRPEFGTYEHSHIVKVKSIVIDDYNLTLEVDSKLLFMHNDLSYDYSTSIRCGSKSDFMDTVTKNTYKIYQTASKMKNEELGLGYLSIMGENVYVSLEQKFWRYFETTDGENIINDHAKEILSGLSKTVLKLHRTNGPIPRGLI